MKEFGDKPIGKKWIHLKRNILHRVWAILEDQRLWNTAWLVFMGWVISQANEWEDDSNYLGEGVETSRNWATAHFLVSYVSLRTVMVPVGVSFN